MENLWNTNSLKNLVEINSGICLNQFCWRKGRGASRFASLSLPVSSGKWSPFSSCSSLPAFHPPLSFFLPLCLISFLPPSTLGWAGSSGLSLLSAGLTV